MQQSIKGKEEITDSESCKKGMCSFEDTSPQSSLGSRKKADGQVYNPVLLCFNSYSSSFLFSPDEHRAALSYCRMMEPEIPLNRARNDSVTPSWNILIKQVMHSVNSLVFML